MTAVIDLSFSTKIKFVIIPLLLFATLVVKKYLFPSFILENTLDSKFIFWNIKRQKNEIECQPNIIQTFTHRSLLMSYKKEF